MVDMDEVDLIEPVPDPLPQAQEAVLEAARAWADHLDHLDPQRAAQVRTAIAIVEIPF